MDHFDFRLTRDRTSESSGAADDSTLFLKGPDIDGESEAPSHIPKHTSVQDLSITIYMDDGRDPDLQADMLF